jgi:hypothetical protein
MITQPFKRFISLMGLLASCATPAERSIQLALAGGYTSRGKGRGGHSGKKWGPQSSNRNMQVVDGQWRQIENGARERARRMRQIQKGIIHVV